MSEIADYSIDTTLPDSIDLADADQTLTEERHDHINPNWNDAALYSFVKANENVLVNADGQVMTLSSAMNMYPGPWGPEYESALLGYAQYLVANRVEEGEKEEDKEPAEAESEKEDFSNPPAEEDISQQEAVQQEDVNLATRQAQESQPIVAANNSENQNIPLEGQSEPETWGAYETETIKEPSEDSPDISDIKTEKPTTVTEIKDRTELPIFEKAAVDDIPFDPKPEEKSGVLSQPAEDVLEEETPVFEIPNNAEPYDTVGEITSDYEQVQSHYDEEPGEIPSDVVFMEPSEFIEDEFVLIDREEESGFEDAGTDEEPAPILLFEQDDAEEIFSEPEKQAISETLIELAEAIEIAEVEVLDTVEDKIDEILDIVLSFEEISYPDSVFDEETLEKLGELFVELFESLGIEYTEEMPKQFARFAIQGKLTPYLQKIKDQDFDELLHGLGTHESVPPVLFSSDSSQNFVDQVYALGRSALRLSDLALAA